MNVHELMMHCSYKMTDEVLVNKPNLVHSVGATELKGVNAKKYWPTCLVRFKLRNSIIFKTN
ncbi:MAG: hypothetical protein CME32_17930 [Gimesia sp.]|nr:hypothetical protein [Gimesia sp.]